MGRDRTLSRRRFEPLQRRVFPHSPLSNLTAATRNTSFEPVLWSAIGSRGWSPSPQSISPDSKSAVWRLLCREAFHRVLAPPPRRRPHGRREAASGAKTDRAQQHVARFERGDGLKEPAERVRSRCTV
jgi:hypothetical protein